jgi:hypothetical protein
MVTARVRSPYSLPHLSVATGARSSARWVALRERRRTRAMTQPKRCVVSGLVEPDRVIQPLSDRGWVCHENVMARECKRAYFRLNVSIRTDYSGL